MNKQTPKHKQLLVLIVLTIPTVWLSARNLEAWSIATRSPEWPTTRGEVTRVFRHESSTGRPGSGALRVTYMYQVNGQVYTSSRYDAAGHPSQNTVLPTPLIVRYDPARPERAVLVAGTSGVLWFQIGVGGLLAAFIASSWLYAGVSRVTRKGRAAS